MRIDVKKFLFIGLNSQKEEFFRKAQEFGIVHFIKASGKADAVMSQDVEHVVKAIKILRGLPVVDQEETDDYELTDGIVSKILDLRHRLDALREEERLTRLEMARVTPFGEFSPQEIKDLERQTNRKIQFYAAKQGLEESGRLPETAIHLTSENGLEYFIAINPRSTQFEGMVEMHIPQSVDQLKQKHQQIVRDLHDTRELLKANAKYSIFLHHSLVHKLNQYHLDEATSLTIDEAEGTLFVVEGWVPKNKMEALQDLTRHLDVDAQEVVVEECDAVPTHLENTGFAKIGEDLVHIYDTPSSTDKDPSLWVLFFFSLFFAMILGDAGYGLALLLVTLFVRYKYPKMSKAAKRALNLGTILCVATIVWGIITTSTVFGYEFPIGSPMRKLSVMEWLVEKKVAYHLERKDDVWEEWVKKKPELESISEPRHFLEEAVEKIKNGVSEDQTVSYVLYSKFSDNIIMEMALLAGVIHIILSFLRYLDRHWSGIGWVVFIIGCYLYLPTYLHATSMVNFAFGVNAETAATDGFYLIVGGAVSALFLAVLQHGFSGMLEAMHSVQIFGDVLSYLRLYALALSGALVIATINDLASGLAAPLAVVVLIFGHAINIVLGIMGGVIHGLRLNFLEWYHYSFEGGGKRFVPLEKVEIE